MIPLNFSDLKNGFIYVVYKIKCHQYLRVVNVIWFALNTSEMKIIPVEPAGKIISIKQSVIFLLNGLNCMWFKSMIPQAWVQILLFKYFYSNTNTNTFYRLYSNTNTNTNTFAWRLFKYKYQYKYFSIGLIQIQIQISICICICQQIQISIWTQAWW